MQTSSIACNSVNAVMIIVELSRTTCYQTTDTDLADRDLKSIDHSRGTTDDWWTESRRPCITTLPCSRRVTVYAFVRRGVGAVRRATCVPQEGVSNGQLGLLLTTADRWSRPGPGRHCRVPKLSIKRDWPLADLCSGMDSATAGRGQRWVTRGAGIPSRRRRRRSRPRPVGQVVHRERCSTWPTGLGPLRDKLADATGYPLPPPSCDKPIPLACH
jgi:hypothetical protein